MEQKLQEYARLVVEVGLNVQKGQTVMLRTPIQCADFARRCADAAYNAGARDVVVEFSDAMMTRMRFLRADGEVFDECPEWFSGKMNRLAEEGAAFLTILAEDPDMLSGVDPDRIRRNQQTRGKALMAYQHAIISNKIRWCIASVPILPWAMKVFPEGSYQDGMERLWDAILKTMRVTGDGSAVARWRAHVDSINARAKKLTELNLDTLHYTNSLVTDLVIGLPENAIWGGGAETGQDGVPFIANMPTEEIFTTPHRERADGRVVSSMPFVLNGNLIRSFALTFEKGRITGVEAQSDREKALLENAIHIDGGAAYLGEVALVPHDSPISNLGILFYNTLFDENASCHLAFGKAYPMIEGGQGMDAETLKQKGINDSITHEDFMIGTADLRITGTTRGGETVDIFTDGNFAF